MEDGYVFGIAASLERASVYEAAVREAWRLDARFVEDIGPAGDWHGLAGAWLYEGVDAAIVDDASVADKPAMERALREILAGPDGGRLRVVFSAAEERGGGDPFLGDISAAAYGIVGTRDEGGPAAHLRELLEGSKDARIGRGGNGDAVSEADGGEDANARGGRDAARDDETGADPVADGRADICGEPLEDAMDEAFGRCMEGGLMDECAEMARHGGACGPAWCPLLQAAMPDAAAAADPAAAGDAASLRNAGAATRRPRGDAGAAPSPRGAGAAALRAADGAGDTPAPLHAGPAPRLPQDAAHEALSLRSAHLAAYTPECTAITADDRREAAVYALARMAAARDGGGCADLRAMELATSDALMQGLLASIADAILGAPADDPAGAAPAEGAPPWAWGARQADAANDGNESSYQEDDCEYVEYEIVEDDAEGGAWARTGKCADAAATARTDGNGMRAAAPTVGGTARTPASAAPDGQPATAAARESTNPALTRKQAASRTLRRRIAAARDVAVTAIAALALTALLALIFNPDLTAAQLAAAVKERLAALLGAG